MRSAGVELEEVNYAKAALTEQQVREIVRTAGSVAAVLNLRHALAKERGWAKQPPSVDELVAAVRSEPNVLRRPILLIGGRAIIGFDRAEYGKLS